MDVEPVAVRLAHGLSRAAVAIDLASDGALATLERTVAQQLVLLHMRSHRHRASVIADLAADLAMSVDDTLTAVGTLGREGLLNLIPTPSYAPAEVRVELTPAGRELSHDVLNWAADLLKELERLEEPDQRRLLRLVLDRILSMQAAGQIPVSRMCVTCRFFDPYAHPGTRLPHHCHLVNAAFGHRQLRLRCPDQQPVAGRYAPASTVEMPTPVALMDTNGRVVGNQPLTCSAMRRAFFHHTPVSSWRTVHLLDMNPPVPKPQHRGAQSAGGADRGVSMAAAQLRIVGRRLPGSSWSGRHGIHVGVQRGSDVEGLVIGDAADAVFDIELDIVASADGEPDFRGPYVQGRRGERFVYLTWGEVDGDGRFAMFRRLKLHLSPLVEQLTPDTVLKAKKIQAVLELTDTKGRPLAASVRPPWVTWRVTSRG